MILVSTNSVLVTFLTISTNYNRVIKSRSPEYEEGSKVVGLFGWRDTTKCNPSLHTEIEYLYPLPDMKSLPESYAIGSVGRVGWVAMTLIQFSINT